jgi:hypothetical protein
MVGLGASIVFAPMKLFFENWSIGVTHVFKYISYFPW